MFVYDFSVCGFECRCSLSKLCFLETRPIQQREGWFTDVMGPDKRTCISPFLSNRPGIKQRFGRLSNIDSNNSSIANTIPVSSVTETVNTNPVTFTPNPKLIGLSDRGTPSFSGKKKLATPTMDSFKQNLLTEGISKEYASLISDARRSGTVSHYKSTWCK